uniref:Uncharacterized protein n=1 Tax=Strongyloides venezuelensis TaxID=75913 RepID=A0A0K0FS54_STRVS
MDSFELEIPSKCSAYFNYSWHMEVKYIVRYIRNKQKCISDSKILLVTKSYVIIMGEPGISEENILLNYGNDPYTNHNNIKNVFQKRSIFTNLKEIYTFQRKKKITGLTMN